MPSSSCVGERETELAFELPMEKATTDELPAFLAELEANTADLGVASYGLSAPTLEQVECDRNAQRMIEEMEVGADKDEQEDDLCGLKE